MSLTTVYAPGIESVDEWPHIPLQQKLDDIRNATPELNVCGPFFDITLPYGCGANVTAYPDHTYAELSWLGVGCQDLERNKIGSRLLRAVAAHLEDSFPITTILFASSPRLGTVRTMVRVFGEDAVVVQKNGIEYGTGSGPSISQMFLDQPVDPAIQYKCEDAIARLK